MHARTHADKHMRACTHTHMHTHAHTYTHIHTHTHTYTHLHTHTHTYIHMYSHSFAPILTSVYAHKARITTHSCCLSRTRTRSLHSSVRANRSKKRTLLSRPIVARHAQVPCQSQSIPVGTLPLRSLPPGLIDLSHNALYKQIVVRKRGSET